MDEQTYKELTAAVKESGIPLDYQKELQRLLDEEYFKDKKQRTEEKILQKEGNTVEFANQKWNILAEVGENKFLCINNDIICKKAFDDNNNNDWKESSLRKYLNGEYLQKFTDVNLVSWQQDLTTDDGLDYGSSEDKIFLLTAEQYRKYRKNMRGIMKDWWWLITADSTVNDFVRYVRTDGSLGNYNADYGYYGVRPACVVDFSICQRIKKKLHQCNRGEKEKND